MPTSDDPPQQAPAPYRATTERLSEADYQSNAVDYLIYCCHLATYDFAMSHVEGKVVLDFGCGTGYGTRQLAEASASVVGVDISADAVDFASATHRAPNLRYQRIDPLPEHRAPFPDASFDVITSFQVVEHIWEADEYVDELARLLRPGGIAIIATPDRSTRLFRGQRPWNLYHVIEYDQAGLRRLLARRFSDIEMHAMRAPAVEGIELARARRLRLLTYPVTFPGAPERLRRAGLRAIKWLQARRGGGARRQPAGEATQFGFGVDDIVLRRSDEPALDIVAVARR